MGPCRMFVDTEIRVPVLLSQMIAHLPLSYDDSHVDTTLLPLPLGVDVPLMWGR